MGIQGRPGNTTQTWVYHANSTQTLEYNGNLGILRKHGTTTQTREYHADLGVIARKTRNTTETWEYQANLENATQANEAANSVTHLRNTSNSHGSPSPCRRFRGVEIFAERIRRTSAERRCGRTGRAGGSSRGGSLSPTAVWTASSRRRSPAASRCPVYENFIHYFYYQEEKSGQKSVETLLIFLHYTNHTHLSYT